jgi:parallel beta-helix repeat protein
LIAIAISRRLVFARKYWRLWVFGTVVTLGSLLGYLQLQGVQTGNSGDMICGGNVVCEGYFWINVPPTVTNYLGQAVNITQLCFGNNLRVQLTIPEKVQDLGLYRADMRYSVSNPNRWKSFNFAGSCLSVGNHSFKVNATKDIYSTVKWSVEGTDIDPKWLGTETETVNYDANEKIMTNGNITMKAPYDTVCKWSNASSLWKDCEITIEVNNSDTKNDLILKGDTLLAKFLKDVKDFKVSTTYSYATYQDSVLNSTCYDALADKENATSCYYDYARKSFNGFVPVTKLDKIYKNSVIGIKLEFKSPIVAEAGVYLRNHFNFTLLSDYNMTLDPDVSDCSELTQANSTYLLTASIPGSPSLACMNVTENNIVLDCQGFTIDGTDAASSYGINVTRKTANNTNITVKNCILTDWTYGIYLYTSSNNTLSNNTASSNANYGIYLSSSSNNNTLTNITASSNSYGIYIQSSSNNNITGGSISLSTTSDYYLSTASTTNNFTNTNFTAARKIYFNDVTSWFNYANDTSGLWLKTNISSGTPTMTRILRNWTQGNVSWNDSIASGTVSAGYNLTGLVANTVYTVANVTSKTSQQIIWTLTTDSNGNLPSFNLTLNTTSKMIMVNTIAPIIDTISANSTLAATYANFTATVTDETALSGWITGSNATGTAENGTWIAGATGVVAWNGTTLPAVGSIVNVTFYANDSSNNWARRTQEFTVTAAPSWSLNSTNSTLAGTAVNHSLNWTSSAGLSGYVFSFCNGTYQNSYTANATVLYNLTNSTNNIAFNGSAAGAKPPGWTNNWAGSNATNANYAAMQTSDNQYGNSTATAKDLETYWRFNFTINENQTGININSINLTFGGYKNATEAGACYIATFHNTTWNKIFTLTTTDATYIANWTSSLNNFIDANKYLVFMCQGDDFDGDSTNRDTVFVDFVQVGVDYSYTAYNTAYCSDVSAILTNDTWTAFNSYTWSNVTKVINSTTGANISWQVFANDTSNNWNKTTVFNYTTTTVDVTVPTIGAISANSTVTGTYANFTATVTDETALSGWITGTNATGTFENGTWIAGATGVVAWNGTTLPAAIGTVVNVTFYANDTANNWQRRTQLFTTTAVPVSNIANVTQTFFMSPTLLRKSGQTRLGSEPVIATTLGARMQGLIRSLAQRVANSLLAPRIATLFKSLSQSFAVQSVSDAIKVLMKTITQILSADSAVGRFVTGVRNVVGQLSLSGVAQRTALLIRAMAQAFGENLATAGMQYLYRTLSQSFTASSLASRAPVIVKMLTQAVSANGITDRLSYALRLLTQSTNTNLVAARIGNVFRSLTQSLSAANIAQRLREVTRALTQGMVTTNIAGRLASLLRTITQAATGNALSIRARLVPAQVIQALNLNSLAARTASILKSITQNLTGSQLALRIFGMTRTLSQSLSALSSALSRALFVRIGTQYLTASGITGRLAVISRALAQAASWAAYTSRVAGMSRQLSQAFNVVPNGFSISAFVRSAAQAIAANGISARLIDALRSLSQTFSWVPQGIYISAKEINMVVAQATVGVSQFVSRLTSSSRSMAQSLLVQPAMLRMATVIKALSQSLSASNLAARVYTVVRTLTQAASIDGITGRLSYALRLLTQNASANLVASRVRDVFRSLAQSLAATDIAGRVSFFYRALAQQFSAGSATLRLGSAVRTLAQSFSVSSLASRTAAFARLLVQTLFPLDAASRIMSAVRSVSQAANANPVAARLSSMLRAVPQTLASNNVSARFGYLLRTLTQSFAGNSIVGRIFGASRALSQSATLSDIPGRFVAAIRSLTQGINAASVMASLRSVARSLTQSVGVDGTVGRIASMLRAATQAAVGNNLVSKIREVPRQLTQAVSANAVTTRMGSMLRLIAQSLAGNLSASRIWNTVRTATGQLSLSDIGQRAGYVYRTLSQSITANAAASRIMTMLRTAAQAITANDVMAKAGSFVRAIAQSANAANVASRFGVIIKTLTQSLSAAGSIATNLFRTYEKIITSAMNLTANVVRLGQMGRTLTQALDAANVAGRLAYVYRTLTQSFTAATASSRLLYAYRMLTQAMSANDVAARAASMLRMITQSLAGNAVVSRMGSLVRAAAQTLGANTLASRIGIIGRMLSQWFGISDMARYSSELTYNKFVTAYFSLTDSVGRGFAAFRPSAQTLGIAQVADRLQSLARSVAQALAGNPISGRVYSTLRAMLQSISYSGQAARFAGILRTASQTFSAGAGMSRLLYSVRAIAQALSPDIIAARAAGMLRTLAQGFSTASAVTNVVFRLYEVSASAAMSISNGAARIAGVIRASVEALSAADGLQRLLSAGRMLTQAIGQNTIALRAGYAFRALAQYISAAQTTLGAIARGRLATLGVGFGAVAARTVAAFRAVPQSLSFASDAAGRLPEMIYQKIVSLGLSLTAAVQRIAAAGRLATGAFSFADAASRVASWTRAIGQTLNANQITSRATAFYRNVFTSLSVLFGWLFRFPAWFYSSQPACEAAGYNWCSGSCTTLSCGVQHNVTYADVNAYQQLQVNATGTNVSIALLSNTALNNVAFETWSHEDTPAATTLAADTDAQSLRYFNVTSNSTLNATTLEWMMMKFEYTESELSSAGLSESTLSLYTYNETLGTWLQLTNSSTGVFGTGVDTAANYAWVNKTNMSLYAIGGLYVNEHACSASAECYSNACCSGTCQSSCAAPAPTPVSPGGGGGGGAIFIKPPAESAVKYKRIAVLREVVPGQAVMVGVEVKNEGATAQKDMVLAVSGVPDSWLSTSVSSISMQPSESRGFNVMVAPPAGAAPGDYKVTIKLKNAGMEAENFFFVRVRQVPADYDKPIVTRQVSIDRESNQTSVDIVVSNPYRGFERIDVVESIPKELANSTEYVDFVTKPSEIVRKDPIVMWSITGMAAGDTRTISYSMKKVLDEFTPYIYWPLRQLNVISPTAPSTMKLTGFALPYFTPGTASTLTFKVKNTDTVAHNFTFEMELPIGWKMQPESIKHPMGPGGEEEFKITVIPPMDAAVGRSMVRAAFGWDGTYVVKEYAAEVNVFVIPLLLAAVLAMFVMGAVYGYHVKLESKAYRASDHAEKLQAIKKAVSAEYPQPAIKRPETAEETLKSELPALRKLRAYIAPAVVRAEPPSSRMAALERLKNSLKRKNRP